MFFDASKRSDETEIMDDLEMEGDVLSYSLAKLDWINKWLGGNNVTLHGVDELLRAYPKDKVIKIVDIGSGSGDMLRLVVDRLRKKGRKVSVLGMDANEFTVNYARQASADYPEIEYKTEFVSADTFLDLEYDILLGTLFLHHLSDEDIIEVMKIGTQKAKLGVVINDLNRSNIAYLLFNLLTLFVGNYMIRQDGLTSITKGFKRSELEHYTSHLNVAKYAIRWKWAWRYQWILFTKKSTPSQK